MTNFEKIKQMSVEELSEWIINLTGRSTMRNIMGEIVKDKALIEGYAKWLESEVDDELTE